MITNEKLRKRWIEDLEDPDSTSLSTNEKYELLILLKEKPVQPFTKNQLEEIEKYCYSFDVTNKAKKLRDE